MSARPAIRKPPPPPWLPAVGSRCPRRRSSRSRRTITRSAPRASHRRQGRRCRAGRRGAHRRRPRPGEDLAQRRGERLRRCAPSASARTRGGPGRRPHGGRRRDVTSERGRRSARGGVPTAAGRRRGPPSPGPRWEPRAGAGRSRPARRPSLLRRRPRRRRRRQATPNETVDERNVRVATPVRPMADPRRSGGLTPRVVERPDREPRDPVVAAKRRLDREPPSQRTGRLAASAAAGAHREDRARRTAIASRRQAVPSTSGRTRGRRSRGRAPEVADPIVAGRAAVGWGQ